MQGQQVLKFDPNKLIFGGDVGFGISRDYWTAGGSPQVGYKLTDRLHIGAGIGYRYARSDKDYYTHTDNGEVSSWQTKKSRYTENSVSLNLFAHYYPWQKLLLSVKPEIMRTWYKETLAENTFAANQVVPALIVGGGLYLNPVILQLNYELIHHKYSPYSDNIFFSIGFMF
jgi:hypothetical protein